MTLILSRQSRRSKNYFQKELKMFFGIDSREEVEGGVNNQLLLC